MSKDLSFWKYEVSLNLEDNRVYTELSQGKFVEGIAELPVSDILKTIDSAFATWHKPDSVHYENGEEMIEVFTTSQFLRFDCYQVSEQHMNRLIDRMLEYGCPLYDSAIDVRFDSVFLSLSEAAEMYVDTLRELLGGEGFRYKNKTSMVRKSGECQQRITLATYKVRGCSSMQTLVNGSYDYPQINKLVESLKGETYRKGFPLGVFHSDVLFHTLAEQMTEEEIKYLAQGDYRFIVDTVLPLLESCNTPEKLLYSLKHYEAVQDSIYGLNGSKWLQIAILLYLGDEEAALSLFDHFCIEQQTFRLSCSQQEEIYRNRIKAWRAL